MKNQMLECHGVSRSHAIKDSHNCGPLKGQGWVSGAGGLSQLNDKLLAGQVVTNDRQHCVNAGL